MDKKVLVVDDEQSIVTLLKYNLEQAGYSVVTGMDGEEGIRLAGVEKPDLMVLDLMLRSWMEWKFMAAKADRKSMCRF